MWIDLLLHKVRTFADANDIGVTYTHIFTRRHSFLMPVQDIIAIDAILMPEFVMGLFFYSKSCQRRLVSQDMQGWDNVLEVVKNYFHDFDWQAYENAQHYTERPFRCWSKVGLKLRLARRSEKKK